MKREIASGKHIGVSLGRVENGKISFHNYGHVDLQNQEAISENDIFEIASLGKVFTAVLFAKFFARNLCAPTDPISRYVPETVTGETSLLSLLTHTSGLPREPDDFVSIAPNNSFSSYDELRLLRALQTTGLTTSKVGNFSYSNFGYMILGLVAKRVVGEESFSDLATSEVLKPLGLDNTFYTVATAHAHRLRCGYTPDKSQVSYLEYGAFESAGGAKSTASDLIKLVALLLGEGASSHGMASALTKTIEQYVDQSGKEISFGWHVRKHQDRLCYFHPGGLAGVKSAMLFCPELKTGLAYVSNTESHVRAIWDVLIPPS